MAESSVGSTGAGRMPAERWRAAAGANPVWRNWGDAHYAFDPRSNQTHFLNTLAVEIFHLLAERPMTHAALCAELVSGYGLEEAPALYEAVASTLHVLDRLGLLERGP